MNNSRCSVTGKFKKSNYFDNVEGNLESYGIYQITNIVNGKKYIGSCYSNTFKKRWFKHIERLSKNLHVNKYLQFSWNKYGKDSFEFSIKEYSNRNKEVTYAREQYYINTEIIFSHDYNLNRKAEGGGICKFDERECLDIIMDYITNDLNIKELGMKYNVSKQTMNKIVTGKYYNCRNIDILLINKCKLKSKKSILNASKLHNKKSRSLTNSQAIEIYIKYNSRGNSSKDLALEYNTNSSTIRDIVKGRTYKEILNSTELKNYR